MNQDIGHNEQMAMDIFSGNGEIVTEEALLKIIKETAAQEKKVSSALTYSDKKHVVMGNSFAVGKEEGSRFAHKISRVVIAQIPANAETLPLVTITTDDILKMGLTRQRLTGHMDDVINELLDYRIKMISVDSKKRTQYTGVNVFSLASVIPGKGAIVVQLNPALKDHFLNLKTDYMQYALSVVPKMPGYASSKLHELLLSRSRKYDATLLLFTIDDLVTLLNYQSQQENYMASEFVANVIKRAVKHINDNCECRVFYKTVQTGRQTTHVRFYVESGWKTFEEKQAQLEEIAAMRATSPEWDAYWAQGELNIKELLKTGEGELFLEAKNNFNATRRSSLPPVKKEEKQG